MASDPNVPTNPPGGPYFTQRLWSEEVAIARAEAGDLGSNRDPSYEFGNGRRFVEPLNRVWDEGNVAPVSTISPVISGTSTVGSVLTVSAGSWSGVPAPTLAYQWMRDSVEISGQTAMTYTVVSGDVTKTITCRETATNIAGSASASSNGIAIPAVIPVNTVAPVVSGLAEVGATLTATTGTWTGSPTPTYAYQWMLGISTIVGEISSTYVVLSNDQGEDITCVVTATNAAGSASESSNIISIPAANPDAVIEALFANNEVGVFYDPSDLTTMFQDRAGTTPVTEDGQTVGLILDKSKGLVLGPELVANGTFTTNTTGWTASGSEISIDSSRLKIDARTSYGWAYQAITTVVGRTYRIAYSCTNGDAPALYVRVDPSNGLNALNFDSGSLANGDGVGYFVATSTTSYIKPMIAGDTKFAFFDNISVKEIQGNHATAPSDASRPLYKTDGTYHWLQFDGVNDSLSTAAINFTGTDKMSVFSGVRKKANNDGMLYELSDNTGNGRPGSFYMVAQSGSTGYVAKLGGNATDNTRSSTGQSPPATNVLVSLFDFAQSTAALENLLRINAAVTGTSAGAAAGTGNFGNYLFYIGQRGSISLPFNGNIYSLIVRGALSTADEITATETWVNNKTGAF